MRLFYCSTDAGCCRYLFAEDSDEALELYSVCIVLESVRPSKVWVLELTPNTVARPCQEHLREALSWEQQGFGTYQHGEGWRISRVQAEFDRLSTLKHPGDVS
ncbi:hypothetical protein GCM10023264_25780 [Sphingomonas daechungensis]